MKVLAISMLLSVMTLAPVVSFAQSAEPTEPAQQNQESKPYSPTIRRAAEAGGGLAAMFAGGIGAGGITYFVVTSYDSGAHDEEFADAIMTVMGGAAGAAIALPFGVYRGGQWAGADGSALATYLGGATGLAVGTLTVLGLDKVTNQGWPVLAVVAGPLAGSMIGYEMSLDDAPAEPQSSAGVEVYPTLAATPDGPGGVVGLGGRF